MNQQMMEEAQEAMAAAEAIAQEVSALASAVPVDPEAIAAKQAEYGAAFIAASAMVSEANYASPD